MVIVSQDKTELINFNNVENIYISGKYVSINYKSGENAVIGTYKTENRAKEILEEISSFYIINEYQNKVYRMPKD